MIDAFPTSTHAIDTFVSLCYKDVETSSPRLIIYSTAAGSDPELESVLMTRVVFIGNAGTLPPAASI